MSRSTASLLRGDCFRADSAAGTNPGASARCRLLGGSDLYSHPPPRLQRRFGHHIVTRKLTLSFGRRHAPAVPDHRRPLTQSDLHLVPRYPADDRSSPRQPNADGRSAAYQHVLTSRKRDGLCDMPPDRVPSRQDGVALAMLVPGLAAAIALAGDSHDDRAGSPASAVERSAASAPVPPRCRQRQHVRRRSHAGTQTKPTARPDIRARRRIERPTAHPTPMMRRTTPRLVPTVMRLGRKSAVNPTRGLPSWSSGNSRRTTPRSSARAQASSSRSPINRRNRARRLESGEAL